MMDKQQDIEKTGRIIYEARELEGLLRELGAVGTGLGELTADLRKSLPESTLRDIYYVIGVRNRIAHESGGFPADIDFETFESICRHLNRSLSALLASRRAACNSDEVPPAPPAPELEELENWRRELNARLRLCACLPLFNWLFFLALILGGVSRSLAALGIGALQLLALPLLVEAWRGNAAIYGTAGGGLALGAYLLALATFTGERRPGRQRNWGWLWYLPGVNFFFVAALALCRMRWAKLLVGLAGLWLDIWAIIVLFRHDWWHFATGMTTGYVLSLIAVVIWGRAPHRAAGAKHDE